MRRHLGTLAVLAALLTTATIGVTAPTPAVAATNATVANLPLLPGTGADPDIHTYQGKYYMLYNGDHTGTEVRMRVASSLAGLADGSEISVWTPPSSMPDISSHVGWGGYLFPSGGRWYIYMQGDDGDQNHGKSFVLESANSDPTSTYTFKAYIPGVVNGLGYAAGPALVGSQLYLFQTYEGGIWAAKASNPYTLTTGWSKVAQAATSGWECANGRCIDEGSNIVVHGNKVFNIFSAGGYESPDYCVGMMTATLGADLTQASSWTKSSGCVFKRNDSVGAYGPGSMTWFTSPDGSEDWVAYHVKTSTAVAFDGSDRRLMAKKVTWNSDGTPNFGQPQQPGASTLLPSGDSGVNNSAIAAVSSGGSVSFFARASSGAITQRAGSASNTSAWSALPSTGSAAVLAPAAESRVAGTIDVFTARADGTLAHAYNTGSGWSGWENFGAPTPNGLGSAPSATSWGPNRQSVYVRGSDGKIYEKWWSPEQQWSSWQDLGAPAGGALSAPAAVSRTTDRVDLFVRTANNAIATKSWNGSSWSAWQDLGQGAAGLVSAPSAASWNAGRMHIYALGRDGNIWERYWTSAAGWANWQSIGKPSSGAASAPAVTSRVDGTTDVTVRTPSGDYARDTWNGSSWSGWTDATAQ
jgi:GH43 family beta-xylosidase